MIINITTYYFIKSWQYIGSYIIILIYLLSTIMVSQMVSQTEAIHAISVSAILFIVPMILLFMLHNIIKITIVLYKDNNIFYFLFFIFYFLLDLPYRISNLIQILSIIFILIYCILFIIYKVSFLKRYLFAFLTAISDILLKYSLTNNFTEIFTTSNTHFYNLGLYWIPLSFAIIQLSIEAYYFYKKEKPKWIRYNRMKKYKESKK